MRIDSHRFREKSFNYHIVSYGSRSYLKIQKSSFTNRLNKPHNFAIVEEPKRNIYTQVPCWLSLSYRLLPDIPKYLHTEGVTSQCLVLYALNRISQQPVMLPNLKVSRKVTFSRLAAKWKFLLLFGASYSLPPLTRALVHFYKFTFRALGRNHVVSSTFSIHHNALF